MMPPETTEAPAITMTQVEDKAPAGKHPKPSTKDAAAAPSLPGPEPGFTTGILPSQSLRDLIEKGALSAERPILEEQIQPASLDLRLGARAYRVQASFLPGPGRTVAAMLDSLAMHEMDLSQGAVLERGCVYIVPLQERLSLRRRTSAVANPKSSTGRLDLFARVITDEAREFDSIREGYEGPLWAEISPRSFSVLAREGERLVQLRIKAGSPRSSQAVLERLHAEIADHRGDAEAPDLVGGMLPVTVDTLGAAREAHREDLGKRAVIGYRAKKHGALIDLSRIGHYDPRDFWEPIEARRDGGLILDPDEFYILASREAITVPPDHAAEMIAYDTLVGEFRVHYAGFFDPGFGHAQAGGAGSRAVLEVRSHEVPFLLEDGQIVGRLVYERLTERPDLLYGRDIGSTYQRQGLKLSKHFKAFGG
jgi:dCTP deaminase